MVSITRNTQPCERWKIDGFAEYNQHVNLRKVIQHKLGSARRFRALTLRSDREGEREKVRAREREREREKERGREREGERDREGEGERRCVREREHLVFPRNILSGEESKEDPAQAAPCKPKSL